MRNRVFIDNNVWDVFYRFDVDLRLEMVGSILTLWITREGEFEIQCIPQSPLRAYVDGVMRSGLVGVDACFGFYDINFTIGEQRVGGFSDYTQSVSGGRFIEADEALFIVQNSGKINRHVVRPTRLFKHEADVALASRAIDSVVLTADKKGVLKNARYGLAHRIIDMTNYSRTVSLVDFIKSQLTT